MPTWRVRPAQNADLDAIKRLFDAHRTELGFVLRPALARSILSRELLVATDEMTVFGAVHYHHRRDRQTTLYHIAVDDGSRRERVGTALIKALCADCIACKSRRILLKCPTGLPANNFYRAVGFQHQRTEAGKHRKLNVWIMELSPPRPHDDPKSP